MPSVKNETENNRFAYVDLHNHRSGISSVLGAFDFGLNSFKNRVKVIRQVGYTFKLK